MNGGPTIYAAVEKDRTEELAKRVDESLMHMAERIAAGIKDGYEIRYAVQDAYRRGVVDGYAQGVAAAVADGRTL